MQASWLSETNQPLVLFAITLVTIWILVKLRAYQKIPPGPFGFPIIGYLPFLTKDPCKIFVDLGKKYGNIFSVNIGRHLCIIVNDCDVAKQILNHPYAYARPPKFFKLAPGAAGFISSSGESWQEQRRFCVGAMKNLGMGRGEWENMIQEETGHFTEEIKSWQAQPTDYQDSLQYSITGNTLSLLIGRKLSENTNDLERKVVTAFVNDFIPSQAPTSPQAHLPTFVLKLLAMLRIAGVAELLKVTENFGTVLRKEVVKTMLSQDLGKKTTFIQLYLQELAKKGENDKNHHFSVDNLVGNMTALFLGGVDTIKTSLHWLLLIVASHPEIQQRLHQEIDDVAGRDRRIYWDERNQFPYLMATVNELQRWAVIAPLLVPRWTMGPIGVGPYTIPKGSVILVNGWNLMKNPKNHEDPDVFKPERFLKKDDKPLEKIDNFIPFSVGKRGCPGEQVAMMTIFLYLTAILQKFRLCCPNGKSVDFRETDSTVIRQAVAQELCFIHR